MIRVRQSLEYAAAWLILKTLGVLPRRTARRVGAAIASCIFPLLPSLRRTAMFNLTLAFPDWTDEHRRKVVRQMVRQLGWMSAEFAQFPKLRRENIEKIIALDGMENYLQAERRGKGVLFLTGHFGAWELAPVTQAIYVHPIHFLARAIENQSVDALVNHYRMISGNTPIEKNESARTVLRVLRGGGTVGILADQNTMPDESVFVDFFGIPAATTTGIARIAARTGAGVVPADVYWEACEKKYHLRLQPEVELASTGDAERDVTENTARFNRVIENIIREHPEQWIWVHKRWHARPPGEKPIYPS
jgi:Kdo2-lipid IVA lauroyltransferase/acyltransferase